MLVLVPSLHLIVENHQNIPAAMLLSLATLATMLISAAGQSAVQCNPPCLNNGICYLSPATLDYACDCSANYTGEYCQVPPAGAPAPARSAVCNPPCENGGQCYQEPFTQELSCICSLEFSGSYCQTGSQSVQQSPGSATPPPPSALSPALVCNPPCENGVCYQEPFTEELSCLCNSGYTGTYCQIGEDTQQQVYASPPPSLPASPASPSAPPPAQCNPPCENGGQCYQEPFTEELSCICNSGYTGTYCQTGEDTQQQVYASPPPSLPASTSAPPPAQCNPPCQNGGQCYQEPFTEELSCVCDAGYSGLYCQDNAGGSQGQTAEPVPTSPPATYYPPPAQIAVPTPPTPSAATCNPPCQQGECYQDPATQLYTCICDSGFTGLYCNTPVGIGSTPEVPVTSDAVPATPTSTSTASTEAAPQSGSSSLSGGAIAGIVIGVAVAVAALLAAGFFALRFSQRALRGEGRAAAMGKAASFKRFEDEPVREIVMSSSGKVLDL